MTLFQQQRSPHNRFAFTSFFTRLLMLLIGLTFSLVTQAMTVSSQGQALIGPEGKAKAREDAIAEASRLALLQAGNWFSTSQEVDNGILRHDTARMGAEGRIRTIKVTREVVSQNVLTVFIEADIESRQSCSRPGQTSNYRKNVVIAAFPLVHPDDATLGRIGNISQDLSQEMARRMQGTPGLNLIPSGQLQVLPASTAPTAGELPNISLALPILRHMTNIQYVISGRLTDLSLAPVGQSKLPSVIDPENLRQYLPFVEGRYRQFAIEVFIHDANDGQLIWQHSYSTQGAWISDHTQSVGFGTATFWKSLYGQAVNLTLNDIDAHVGDLLQCQPFNARIIRSEGPRLLVNAGRQAGLRVGDTLQVYRQRYDYGPQGDVYPQLDDTGSTAKVTSIQGDSSWLTLPFDASQINIQQDDRVFAW
ncbi:flagellar assembly protein T N-terminal domain-containing protein [Pokkaliibacter sp. CJK22405]|uniref:flagellar assembly protein T N-terminal domain-containing protein n=1 Tax=Pokkaliibacter sp. CJK22405 TaxID=3384615 RepID=UPI00398554F1